MIKPTYRFLLGASLALLMGAAAAQTGDDPSSRLPANKPASQDAQIQPEAQPTDKMTGPSNPQNQPADQSSQSAQANAQSQPTDQTMHKPNPSTSKAAQHPRKSANSSNPAMSGSDKAYREALRQCASEQEQSRRDSCLDSAIAQFQGHS